ncbi:nucleotidyltransferase family protein [Candidatus Micrarchaeota archaeon]|nr:nucleotidyltransferase family protein [Candidatus Micrarchaeota archaeon]
MATKLELERETHVLETLDALQRAGIELVVVGGYAVDAYAPHRFSVDLDVVVRKQDLQRIASKLEQLGYKHARSRDDFAKSYKGEFQSFIKQLEGGRVSVDLLVNCLCSRSTSACWSFDYIKKHSVMRLVSGIARSVEAVVPSRELLAAMKIHSGRLTDLRDLVMLSLGPDVQAIVRHSLRGDRQALKATARKMLIRMGKQDFRDALKGTFSIQRGRVVEKEMASAASLLEALESSGVKQGF